MTQKHYRISLREMQKIHYHSQNLLKSLEEDRVACELSMKELLTLNIIKNSLAEIFVASEEEGSQDFRQPDASTADAAKSHSAKPRKKKSAKE
ncbi:hypothetical protein PT277_05110 [Acetobacteraceae bacterium ESL0709]|nr:hypothetical protein [Acetobacteraceae bacterium ESL0697]MDF7678074.1 hypothetical protein [Acetobacteraceae bacterium ESL0709]